MDTLAAALDDIAGLDPVFMPPGEKGAALVTLGRVVSRVEGLRMQLLAAAGEVTEETAARSTTQWLRTQDRPAVTGADAAAERLGVRLRERWTKLGDAVLAGDVTVAQARVIVRCLDNLLPEHPPAEILARAEAHLVDLAAQHTVEELRALGEAILERVAPDTYDDQERKKLAAAERRAAAATRLSFRNRGDGSVDLSARIPEALAARLKSYLHAWTSPRHTALADEVTGRGGTGVPLLDPVTGERLPRERVMGHAFCALLEAIDPAVMPTKAGAATTLIVTIDYDDLVNGTGVATLADGTRISAGEARRLACNAGIIPAVLGGASEVLDLGRLKRLFEGALRRALGIQFASCATEGCTVPGEMCEAHHLQPWSKGGKTRIQDGTLLCGFHHHRAHDETYDMTTHTDGTIRFHRRR